jgi:hypothetical protein
MWVPRSLFCNFSTDCPGLTFGASYSPAPGLRQYPFASLFYRSVLIAEKFYFHGKYFQHEKQSSLWYW